uniref:Splicing factor 3B subunit 4 n=2 Tax=Magnoliopsida TaxID=3398 RepID=A0A6V7PXI4_ANACO|nr:unnamed protein product [Ananas comosus var. bracteatus]
MTTRIAPGVGANLLGQHSAERNQDATTYVGNLDPQVSEELLWELFVQAGPVVNVYVPKDRVTNLHQGYGFVEFRSEEDADYAIKILNMIKIYGKPIRVNKASQDKKSLDVGANLFVGNLDPDVDEKLLYDTFSAFGVIVTNPKIMRDPETGNSRGFGFVSYDSFDASDAAIEAMNGQYLCNRQITVSYAYKKDTKGERHGTPAERVLAASNPGAQKNRPHTLFASGPPTLPNGPPVNGAVGAPIPRPFANGPIPAAQVPSVRPPPPPIGQFPLQFRWRLHHLGLLSHHLAKIFIHRPFRRPCNSGLHTACRHRLHLRVPTEDCEENGGEAADVEGLPGDRDRLPSGVERRVPLLPAARRRRHRAPPPRRRTPRRRREALLPPAIGEGGALTRISAAIKLKLLPFSAAEGRSGEGFLARSFSKRIRGSFWKKRSEDAEGKGEGEGERDRKRSVRVKDIVRLRSFEEIEERRSFGCPSPVVSSCGSSSESESSSSSGSDFVSSSIGSSEFLDEIESAAAKNSSPPRSPNANANANPNPNPNPRVCTVADIGVRAEGTATGDTKGVESESREECQMEAEEKEQLSPVAVMDFPYENEDEDEDEDATTTTTSLLLPLSNKPLPTSRVRTKLQLLQKIRRFESLADLDPVDLESRFAASDEEGETDVGSPTGSRTARGLLALLEAATGGAHHGSFEKLLLDFFAEGLSHVDSATTNSSAELLEYAREWTIDGARRFCWEEKQLEISEMERNGRWRCFGEEKVQLSAHLERAIFDSLVEEFVSW